jgi:hypothetical protein
LVLGCLLAALASDAAAEHVRPNSQEPAHRWHVVESANFRILSFGSHGASREAVDACENVRERLVRQWLGSGEAANWTPKCDVVLHPSDAAYLREVGSGGRSTAASALIDRRQGRVTLRRIDVRATKSDWQRTALAHELTHVVLADRFAERPLPRWIDEGVALLADPPAKQRRHLDDLRAALAAGGEFPLIELITLADYPSASRWGVFYGQSMSLVDYLVDEFGPRRFMDFVEQSLEQGHERALRQTYDFGFAELQRRWRAHLSNRPAQGAGRASPVVLTIR